MHSLVIFFQPCGVDWGGKKSWDALSTTWNLNSSPRRALWERCDSDFVCSSSTTAPMLLVSKTASVNFAPSKHSLAEPEPPFLRGPQLPAEDPID